MNFVEKLLLVTCSFAITLLVASTEVPIRTIKSQFEADVRLECSSSFNSGKQFRWIRNGQDLCTSNSIWCRLEHSFTLRLLLPRLIRNDIYTCQAISRDGSKQNDSAIAVVIVPREEKELYRAIGSSATIYCDVKTPNVDVRLVRDDNVTCTPEAKWCLQRIGAVGSSRYFDVLNLQANHTYNCQVYKGTEKLSTASIHHIFVGLKPKIHKITISPADPVEKGTVVVANARIYYPQQELGRRWDIGRPVYSNDEIQLFSDELSVLSKNEYESRVSLGPIHGSTDVWLRVYNDYGYDLKYITIRVGVKYGELCDSTVVCATKYTVCDLSIGQCSCRIGYVWDSSRCK